MISKELMWALLIAAFILTIIASVSAANETNYTISIFSTPTANISINNSDYGVTPQNVTLPESIYFINLSRPGFFSNSTTINLTNNTTINFTLSPNNTTTPQGVTITSITPANNTIFSADDTLPTSVRVAYNGNLDLSKSNITLLYNNSQQPFILFRDDPGRRFSFQIDQQPDGIYKGEWTLVSTNNVTTNYNYRFEIITTQPDKAFNIAPAPGKYTTETTTLQAETNQSNYTVQWIISDGYPNPLSSGWKSLAQTGTLYSEAINFENAAVGAVYLKVLDAAGNYRIQPTGIVSSPNFELDFERTRIEVFRDEIAEYEFQVIRKDLNKQKLRCKLEDLIKDRGTSRQRLINTNGKATLLYNDQEVDLLTEYEGTLQIGLTRITTIELVYETPEVIPVGDYEGTIECLIAK